MDLIQPYRLEMATKSILKDLDNDDDGNKYKSLASWWSSSVTNSISKDLEKKKENDGKFVINLASDEYSAAINPNLLPPNTNYVKVAFQQEGKVIAVHAKRARGLMVRYVAENQIIDLDHLKQFNVDGYIFVEDRSKDDMIVFDRPKPEAKAKGKTKSKPAAKSKSKPKPKAKLESKQQKRKANSSLPDEKETRVKRRSTRTRK